MKRHSRATRYNPATRCHPVTRDDRVTRRNRVTSRLDFVRPAFRWFVVSALLTGWIAGWAEAGSSQVLTGVQLPVVEHELANGMRWLVLPRASGPTVSIIVQFRVGGVNEVRGQTGIAHLLEHLLFKGTETLGTRNATAERALFVRMDSRRRRRGGCGPDATG